MSGPREPALPLLSPTVVFQLWVPPSPDWHWECVLVPAGGAVGSGAPGAGHVPSSTLADSQNSPSKIRGM